MSQVTSDSEADSEESGLKHNNKRNSKRKSVIMSISDSRYFMADVKSIQNILSQRHKQLIFVIRRCIVLSTFALFSTVLFRGFVFCYDEIATHISIVYGLWALDMMMNCCCLFLNFICADKLYKRCYGICDKVVKIYLGFVHLQQIPRLNSSRKSNKPFINAH